MLTENNRITAFGKLVGFIWITTCIVVIVHILANKPQHPQELTDLIECHQAAQRGWIADRSDTIHPLDNTRAISGYRWFYNDVIVKQVTFREMDGVSCRPHTVDVINDPVND